MGGCDGGRGGCDEAAAGVREREREELEDEMGRGRGIGKNRLGLRVTLRDISYCHWLRNCLRSVPITVRRTYLKRSARETCRSVRACRILCLNLPEWHKH